MGHGMACAYGTVSEGFAKEKIAVTILLERDRILRRGRVMGSYRLSGPRGFHVYVNKGANQDVFQWN